MSLGVLSVNAESVAPTPTPEEHAQSVVALLNEVAAAILEMGRDAVIPVKTLVDIPMFSIFGRARDLVGSSAELIGAGRANTALVLQRPLFEDSVLLAAMAAESDTGRIELAARWLWNSYNEADGLLLYAKQLKPEDGWYSEELTAAMRVRRQELERFLASRKLKAAPDFNWKHLARKTGREDDLVEYAISQQAVHGNEFIHLVAQEAQEDGGLIAGKPTPFVAALASGMALESGLQAMNAAATLFGIPLPSAMDHVNARYAEVLATSKPG
jgi:hypothetical protein